MKVTISGGGGTPKRCLYNVIFGAMIRKENRKERERCLCYTIFGSVVSVQYQKKSIQLEHYSVVDLKKQEQRS